MNPTWFRQWSDAPGLRARAVKVIVGLLIVNTLFAGLLALRHNGTPDRESVMTTPDGANERSGNPARPGGDAPGGILQAVGPTPAPPGDALPVPSIHPAPGQKPRPPEEPPPTDPGSGSSGGLVLPAPTYLSSRVADYMALPGDQVVVVPDGVYSGGEIVAPHPATGGPYGGWLVLVAQNQGGVVVDLASAPSRQLQIKPGTSRIVFVGFSFINGQVVNNGDHMRYWYTDHQDFDLNYQAEGRWCPFMFLGYGSGDDLEIYGSDFHHGVTEPVFFGSLINDITIQGIRTYDIDRRFEDPVDPGNHVGAGPSSREGGHSSIRILDSYLEGYYTSWATNAGSNTDLLWQNIWHGYANPSPFILDVNNGRRILNARRVNWTIFGDNANYARNGNDPAVIVDGRSYFGANAYQHQDRVQLTDTNVTYGYPAGVTNDPNTARNNPNNPANQWRANHPYNTWNTYFTWK